MAKLPESIKFVVNYLRKSRQDEERERRTGEDTLSEQKMLMERVLKNYEDIIYEQRFEIGSGDKIETRPVFKEVLEELKAGKFDAIAVKEISRLGRGSYTDMGKIYDLILINRVYIITPYKVYDPKNSADLRQIRFELFFAREEFETTRERLVGAKYNYALQGKWIAGSVPFGYGFDEKSQKLKIIEDEAKIVKLIYDLYVNQGKGFYAIATILTRMGIPTKNNKHWQAEVIRRMVEKPVYKGVLEFGKTKRVNGKVIERPKDEWIIVEDAHPPIIDAVTWEKANKLREENKTKTRTNLDFNNCELAGIITCGKCGRKMVRQNSPQKYTKVDGTVSNYQKEYLWCQTNSCTYVKYRDVEQRLLNTLQKDLDDEHLENSIKFYMYNTQSKSSFKNEAQQLKILTTKKNELEKRLNFVYAKYEEGVYSDEEFIKRRLDIQIEIKNIERGIQMTEEQQRTDNEQVISIDVEKVRHNIKNVLDTYKLLEDKTYKNNLLLRVFGKVELTLVKKGSKKAPAIFNLDIQYREDFLLLS